MRFGEDVAYSNCIPGKTGLSLSLSHSSAIAVRERGASAHLHSLIVIRTGGLYFLERRIEMLHPFSPSKPDESSKPPPPTATRRLNLTAKS